MFQSGKYHPFLPFLLQDRLKREWRQANKADAELPDETAMAPKRRLGKEGRRIKKMLRGQDKTGQLYESDSDDKDPYASEVGVIHFIVSWASMVYLMI